MSAIAALERIRAAIASAAPQAAVVSVHTQDLSDARTGKWLVRLPGVYLVCDGIDADAPDAATVRLRVYVLARMADAREDRAAAGWGLAETVLASVIADPHVRRARMAYRDQSGLDQPGVALWEIEAQARHVLSTAAGVADDWRAETILASWAPWIGAAHEPHYRPVAGDPADPSASIGEMLP